MASQTLSQPQQSLSSALPGTWKLAAGRAITLQPRESGVLRVAHGQMWATFEGPHGGPPNDQGDHVIGAGGQLRVRPGQRVVVEAWSAQSPAYFSWDPLPVPVRAATPQMAQVLQPLSDLRLALVLGAGAVGRLLAGLAGLAWDVAAPRSRQGCDGGFAGKAPQTCGAHGAMN